jgi:hypothetical protein
MLLRLNCCYHSRIHQLIGYAHLSTGTHLQAHLANATSAHYVDQLVEGIRRADRLSLSRAVTLCESSVPAHVEQAARVLQRLLDMKPGSKHSTSVSPMLTSHRYGRCRQVHLRPNPPLTHASRRRTGPPASRRCHTCCPAEPVDHTPPTTRTYLSASPTTHDALSTPVGHPTSLASPSTTPTQARSQPSPPSGSDHIDTPHAVTPSADHMW